MLIQYHFVTLVFLSVLGLLIQSDGQDDDFVDCPLCADPTHYPQDPQSRFVAGENTLTCQTAFDLGNLSLPEDNCTFWQSRGEMICECAAGPAEPNECTLCESGTLPDPLRAAVPGRSCTEVQVDAKRDESQYCVSYQQTLGVYCGCDNPQATAPDQEVCRLCGGTNELQDPLNSVTLVIDVNETSQVSCVELEFTANLPGADCNEFQVLYQESCCPEDPDNATQDGAQRVFSIVLTWAVLSVSSILL